MSKIRVMSDNLANKIAAGEVVEKCLSIVKELVENSIDAKASEIKIELKESGLREIKVTDDGIGMEEEDALLAFQRHATSKLYTDDDLFNILSLGFRGEALPSIAAVSNVVLKTSTNNLEGVMINIKGGTLVEKDTCSMNKGTSICVNDLFYNTPARLKHLSSTYTELSNIIEYVNKIALSYPNIKFILKNDDKELLNTDGSNNLLKVIKAIYGIDVTKKMLFVEGENNDYKVKGYVSLPELSRANKSHMTTIVNGRVIKNTSLNRCINEAYSNFKEDTRYPIVVLLIETDPSLIDVNIHPSKLDIKFSNFEELQNLIKELIINEVKKKLLIPKIEVSKIVEEKEVKYENLSLNLERNIVKEPDIEYKKSLEDFINNDNNNEEITEDEQEEYVEEVKKLPELYPVGLLLGTYIVCENEKGIYLIDQHAAQERVNYEKYSYILSHPTDSHIDLLVPYVLEFPKNEFIIIKENIDILDKLNINIETFGGNSFRILSHPTWFPKGNEELIVKKIMELIIEKEKNFSLEKFNDNIAKMVSCKMSIKANTNITLEGMESIINQLRKCNNPYNCPHGRPTIINFSIYELEKMFKRSI